MNTILRHLLVILLLLVAPVSTLSDETIPGYVERDGVFFFLGTYLKVTPLKPGVDIPLNTVIIMPRKNSSGVVGIEFDREVLSRDFLRDVFFLPNQFVIQNHNLCRRGIEALLDDTRLILRIHSGVIFNLRYAPELTEVYRAFKREHVVGKVIEVVGSALYSTDVDMVKEVFANFNIAYHGKSGQDSERTYRMADGSVVSIGPEMTEKDLPSFYPPRLIGKEREKLEEWYRKRSMQEM